MSAGPRVLLSLALLLGGMGGIVGRGTLAFFTSSVVSPGHTFSLGVVDITASTTPTTAAFGWTTTAAGANCANIFSSGTATNDLTQAMVPAMYCVAPLTIANSNANSDDAWMRIRLVRSTASGTAANDAMNDRLKLYMSEYTSSNPSGLQTADCTTSNFKPTWDVSTLSAGATTSFSQVFGTSSGRIGDNPSLSYSSGTITGSRTAVKSLSTTTTGLGTGAGRNVGAHPGISAVTPKTTNDATSATLSNTLNANTTSGEYGAAQASDVLGLVVPSGETTSTGAGGYVPSSDNGLRIRAGLSSVFPTESNMTTTLGSRNSYNIVGNDEVANPVKTTAGTANGTEPHGSNAEAEILKATTRYYCVAIFFPSDTDKSFTTVYAGTPISGGSVLNKFYANTYDSTNNKWPNCTSGAVSGCTQLTNDTITGANGLGDGLAALGTNTYYLTVTAAQKAGRTAA